MGLKSAVSNQDTIIMARVRYLTDPPWRNWLARLTVNRKAGGSSPPGAPEENSFFSKMDLLAIKNYLAYVCIQEYYADLPSVKSPQSYYVNYFRFIVL